MFPCLGATPAYVAHPGGPATARFPDPGSLGWVCTVAAASMHGPTVMRCPRVGRFGRRRRVRARRWTTLLVVRISVLASLSSSALISHARHWS